MRQQKLRSLIEGHTFLQEEGINARLGVSLGIATYPEEVKTKEELIRLADDRVVRAPDVVGLRVADALGEGLGVLVVFMLAGRA